MIGISKLYCGTVEPSDALRYGRHSSTLPSHLLQFSKDKRPVVVWNVCMHCNMKCPHCYAAAVEQPSPTDLDHAEGIRLLDEWGFFDQPEPRLDSFRWMAPLFRLFKPMRIFHFQLGKAIG